MALYYYHLDGRTRSFMADEIERDIQDGKLHLSAYLSQAGQAAWPGLLLAAARGDRSDAWLAMELGRDGRLSQQCLRRKPRGGYVVIAVPATAAQSLSEAEFNRFYIRGLCRRALADGVGHLVVYQADTVSALGAELDARVGARIECAALLIDLRAHLGIETGSGFPGAGLGLSVRLPDCDQKASLLAASIV